MAKITYVSTEALEEIKLNFRTYKHYFAESSNKALLTLFEHNKWLGETNIEWPGIKLKMDELPSITDSENVRLLHSGLFDLPRSYANDERFWFGLILTDCWDYIKYRRAKELEEGTDDDIKNSYLFSRGIKRSNYINCLSRLWWAGALCYDENNNDHYEHVDLIADSAFASNMILLSSSNVTSNKNVFLGLLDCLENRKKNGEKIGRYHFVNSLRYLNSLGGSFLLDTISREEISEIVDNCLTKYGTEKPKGKRDL